MEKIENKYDDWFNISGKERESRIIDIAKKYAKEINSRHKHIICSVRETSPHEETYGTVFQISELVTDMGFTKDDDFYEPIIITELSEAELSFGKVKTKVKKYEDLSGNRKRVTFPIVVNQKPDDFESYLKHVEETGYTLMQIDDKLIES